MSDDDRAGRALPGLARLALGRATVDRACDRRHDEAWLAAAWADSGTRVLVVEDDAALVREPGAGPEPVREPGAGPEPVREADAAAELVLLPPGRAPDGLRLLLGVDSDRIAYFAVIGALPTVGDPAVRPASLRDVGPLLSDRDAGLLTHAVALANWHAVFVHCPRCGGRTRPGSAGHSRRCPADGSEYFPRVDPAMIVLVTDEQDRCLLARNTQWPPRRVSILAGFVEAGESVEQAVIREVAEETGLVVDSIRYLGSQPWPMPQSLMLGFRATAAAGQKIAVDAAEIAEAGWFSRDELRAAVASGRIRLPPPVSIAHRIIVSWYGTELPGGW